MAGESRRAKLGDYFTLQRGTTYKSRLLGLPGPVLLGLASIQRNGGFRRDSLQTYGGESPAKLLVNPGDLYLSLKDVTQSADLLGAVARLPKDHHPGRLTQDTVKLEPIGTDVPIEYLYWLLRTPQYRAYCKAHATGTTNLGLAREDFLAYPAPERTPLRKKIVEVLEDLEEKIEINRKLNETLEAMARALFKSWFVDFDPVTARAEFRTPNSPHTEMSDLFPARLMKAKDMQVPEGWNPETLADVSLLNPEHWTNESAPGSVEYVDLANTKWGTIEATTKYEWNKAPSRAQRVLRSGDTIVGTVRPGNGSYALIGQEGLTGSTGFAVLRPKKPEFREIVYLGATARENIERLSDLADGAAYPAVRPDVVAATPIVRGTDAVIARFSHLVRPLLDKVGVNRHQSRTLAALRDTLLPKLISGEVRITDAERIVGRQS